MTKSKNKLLKKTRGWLCIIALFVCSCAEVSENCGDGIPPVSQGGCPGGSGGGGSSFTDSRDGKRYRTVTIGTQTWMAENLNYNASGSACYNNMESNCNTFGRLYDGNTARGACPSGWHLPSDAEWETLVKYVDPNAAGVAYDAYGKNNNAGTKLMSASGWDSYGGGTDEYGFSALPGGFGDGGSGSFNYAGYRGYWWSATEYVYRYMGSGGGSVGRDYNSDLYSVRCVRD